MPDFEDMDVNTLEDLAIQANVPKAEYLAKSELVYELENDFYKSWDEALLITKRNWIYDVSDKVTAQYFSVSLPGLEYINLTDHNGNQFALDKNEALNLVPIIQELWLDDFKKLDLGPEV